jgi:magnesium chelatase family protein
MSLAVLKSRALAGMEAPEVTVEVHLANGLPSFTIVVLPETEVKESKDRVRAALQNARFEFPSRRYGKSGSSRFAERVGAIRFNAL